MNMALEQLSQTERPVMTTKEAAEMLGVSAFEIRRMVVVGDVWGKKIGRYLFLDRKEMKRKALDG
jgi:NADH/NAD ratio-sensing transcriptional regulator Rex